MSVSRWAFLLVFVLASLALSIAGIFWMLAPGRGMGVAFAIPFALQCLEPIVAYGLVRLRDWAYTWGVRWFAVKAIYTLGLAAGAWQFGMRDADPVVFMVIGLFYIAFAVFLHVNDEHFD